MANIYELVVADTSAVINLVSSGFAAEIITLMANKFVVTESVVSELNSGREKGHPHAAQLEYLVEASIVSIQRIEAGVQSDLERLIIGSLLNTIGDGEATTIAAAVERNGCAVIDDRKARRICSRMFPKLQYCGTIDIFRSPNVRSALGDTTLANAVFNSLFEARMDVIGHDEWVINLIGVDRASKCTSLSRSTREKASRQR